MYDSARRKLRWPGKLNNASDTVRDLRTCAKTRRAAKKRHKSTLLSSIESLLIFTIDSFSRSQRIKVGKGLILVKIDWFPKPTRATNTGSVTETTAVMISVKGLVASIGVLCKVFVDKHLQFRSKLLYVICKYMILKCKIL